ncbi:MAG: DoxX family protein [Ferruginibacter sp.]|nr:DoxX family protein [Chitinophagaceae bacterium]
MFNRVTRREKILLYSMAVFYVIAGIYHFVNPLFYKKIMPPWLPGHYTLIYASGVIEIVLGLLLVPEKTRVLAAWGIIALLIAVFPANLQMMLNYREQHHPYLWVAILRLPLQLLLIAWAYHYTKNKRK